MSPSIFPSTHKKRKQWGQNFLIDSGWIDKIVALLPERTEQVWECGAGDGRITQCLLARNFHVTAFEIDTVLIQRLLLRFQKEHEKGRFTVVPGDMLHVLHEVSVIPDVIVGNLPFSSASALLLVFARDMQWIRPSFFIVQEELAQRICAPVRSKSYSSFSVLLQSAFKVQYFGCILPQSFSPMPRVHAALVALYPLSLRRSQPWRQLLSRLCRIGFAMRRKTIANNIKHGIHGEGQRSIVMDACTHAGIIPTQRAEELPPAQWWELVDYLMKEGQVLS